jgi:hypothetical protein
MKSSHIHLASNDWFSIFKFKISKPPFDFGLHSVCHLTRWIFLVEGFVPFHTKFLLIVSISSITHCGNKNTDMKYIGMDDRVEFSNIVLPGIVDFFEAQSSSLEYFLDE